MHSLGLLSQCLEQGGIYWSMMCLVAGCTESFPQVETFIHNAKTVQDDMWRAAATVTVCIKQVCMFYAIAHGL